MNTNSDTEDFKALQKLHITLVLGVLIIAIIIYFLSKENYLSFSFDMEMSEILTLLVAGLSLGAAYISGQKKLAAIQNLESIEEKWSEYRALLIMKYAFIEGPALIGIIIFFMPGNLLLISMSLVLVLILYLMRPSRDRTALDLNISAQEAEQL